MGEPVMVMADTAWRLIWMEGLRAVVWSVVSGLILTPFVLAWIATGLIGRRLLCQ